MFDLETLSQDEWNFVIAVIVGGLAAAAYIFLGPGSGNTSL
jgi:hypothetical protein